MTKLTAQQIRELNMYSVYVDKPEKPLFTLRDLLNPDKTAEMIQTVQEISQSPNKTVAASYFLRRVGMFISMQFYHLATYDEIWKGENDHLVFAENHEYGNQAVSMFARSGDWVDATTYEREKIIRYILHNQCHAMIQQVRTAANISTLTLWENIFGYLLWHYHVLFQNPATAEEAREDFNLLKSDALWTGISDTSLFATYLQGQEPSALLNTVVRTTCCLSKDVPGLMQCGFCPLGKLPKKS